MQERYWFYQYFWGVGRTYTLRIPKLMAHNSIQKNLDDWYTKFIRGERSNSDAQRESKGDGSTQSNSEGDWIMKNWIYKKLKSLSI